MSENAIPGFDAFLYVTGSTTLVAEVRDVELNIEHSAIDSTTHDDVGWESNIKGRRRFTASGEVLYYEGDSGQEELLDRILDGEKFDVVFRPQVGTGNREYTGEARMTNWRHSGPNDDAQAVGIEMQGTGALTDAVQS